VKKIFVLFFVFFVLLTNGFPDDRDDYIRARQIININSQIQAFEAYLLKYPDSEYHKYVYVLLAKDYLGVGNQLEAIKYAGKAEKFIHQLNLPELEMTVLYILLSADYLGRQDKEKASVYADKVIQVASGKQEDVWKKLLASAQGIKNKTGVTPIKVSPIKRAGELYKAGKTDEALKIFRDEYKLKKDGAVAYNIGIILAQKAKADKMLVAEAVNYLLEASVLYPPKSQEAMKLAEGLFFGHYIDKDTGLNYNGLIQRAETLKSTLKKKTDEFNAKYSGKEENEVDKKQMDSDQKALTDLGKNIKQLDSKIRKAVEDFNKVLAQARGRVS
jgi:tetratricopeptide (TPR) repeat protein